MLKNLWKELKKKHRRKKTIRILNKCLGVHLEPWQIEFILDGTGYRSEEAYGGRGIGRSTTTAIAYLIAHSSNPFAYAREDLCATRRYFYWVSMTEKIFNMIPKRKRKYLGIDERVPEWLKKSKKKYLERNVY